MKTLTVLTAAAALAMSMSVAGAQSSMEKPSAMQKDVSGVVGDSAFCTKSRTPPDQLNCNYASRADCEKVAQPGTKTCVPNPKMNTTGAGGKMMKDSDDKMMKK